MNVLKFVNSQDIREHLRSINYEFSALEAAWLVWQSRHTSLQEKHAAWNKIINTMPDCEIGERRNTEARPSLHGFLRELMEADTSCIERFFAEDANAVYAYSYLPAGEKLWNEEYDTPYTTFSLCFEAFMQEYNEDSEGKDAHYADGYRSVVKKKGLNGQASDMEVELRPDKSIWSINSYGDISEKTQELHYCGFKGMWFAFPTPFKIGDIVTIQQRGDGAPMVLEDMANESQYAQRLAENGDYTDMFAWCYMLDDTSPTCIFSDYEVSYMDVEYFRGKLTGAFRVMTALSNFLKDKINVELFAPAYQAIFLEEYLNKIRPIDGWYTKEGLALAGILPTGGNE